MVNDNKDNSVKSLLRDKSVEFLFEEYKSLRSEIIERSRRDDKIQRNSIIVAGAVCSFVFSRPLDWRLSFVLLFVSVTLYIAYLRQARHKAYGIRIGEYIREIESLLYSEINDFKSNDNKSEINDSQSSGNETKLGWEHFLKRERGLK